MCAEDDRVGCGTRRIVFVAALLLLLIIVHAKAVMAGESVPPDGDLIEGAGTEPSDWRRISQRYLKPDQIGETFEWIHPSGAPSELQLTSARRGLIRWERTVGLRPGLYHLTGDIQERGLIPNVDSAVIGLELSDSTFGLAESPQAEPSHWRAGELYLKVGKGPRRVDITCKLVGRGTVSCRRIILVKEKNPAPAGATVIDLDQYPERQEGEKPRPYDAPSGKMWTLLLTIVALTAITISGWIALDPRRQ
jgi:hypothetical protein